MGSIDVLVNNAGMEKPIPAERVSEQDLDWMMNLNLKGTFFCCQAVGVKMLKRGRGRIINISSQASVVAIPGEAVWCTSKGGMHMLTKTLAVEWSGRGVTVNAVGPTFIRTPGNADKGKKKKNCQKEAVLSLAVLCEYPSGIFWSLPNSPDRQYPTGSPSPSDRPGQRS